jgi:hypothetical protein
MQLACSFILGLLFQTIFIQSSTSMTTIKKILETMGVVLFLTVAIPYSSPLNAQSPTSKKEIVIDIAHGQKFYNDPTDMAGKDSSFIERVKYMTGEVKKNANKLNAEVKFQKKNFTPDALAKCDLLFIHIPSSQYNAEEVKSIQQYIQNGGSLFIVMEADYWSTLAQANVNDIVSPFGIEFKSDNPDTKTSGGYSKPSKVTDKRFIIPYHGARIVEGGTPFCYNKTTEEHPFGIFKELKKGGKIIAMGDGMVSLYMTSWEGVNNYQCSEFMNEAFAWLLK